MSWVKMAMEMAVLEEAVEECTGREQVEDVLRSSGIEWETKDFPNGNSLLLFDFGGARLFVDPDFPSVEDAVEWVESMDSWKMAGYVEGEDFNAAFWGGQEFSPRLYHGMRAFDVKPVERDGLLPRNETRGISNRHTGSAVFATKDEEFAATHGSVVFEIDTEAMRSNGYTPEVAREAPIEEEKMRDRLAWSVGLREWENHRYDELYRDGIVETTVVVFGAIPPKYLRRLS